MSYYNSSTDPTVHSDYYSNTSLYSEPFASPSRHDFDSQRDFSSSMRTPSPGNSKHVKQTPPEIQLMKGRRKRRTVASGVAGGVLGLVVGGPVLGIAAGVGGAVVAKKVGKRNEKRRMDKLEAQQNPLRSSATGEFL